MNGSARWDSVESLFHEALQQSLDERTAWVRSVCPDAALCLEVERMLDAHDRRGVLDALVDDVIAPILPRRFAPLDPALALPAHSRYRVIERMGAGGMGVVYRARDERLGRDVALKFLSAHLSADEGAKRRFLGEARAAAAIEHPNICTVHEIGDTDDGQLYIVMSCYDGETLDQRIARGPMPVPDVLRIAGEVARGLSKAHERGIVHRDIKPANVMITSDGLVKVLDFGIAKLADVTQTHTVGAIGTVAYMSPEQAFGELVDHRTDLWSLGVVMYEMLTGARPFRGPAEQAVLVAALSMEPDAIGTVRAEVGEEIERLVRRALAKRPADRFSNAAEMLEAISAAAARSGSGTTDEALHERRAADPRTGDLEETRGDTALTRGGERRPVTIVSCMIDGQDALFERLEPEKSDEILAQIRAASDAIAEQFGGVVNQFSDEGVVLLFGVPTAHDEDTVRAVRAALALRARVAEIASALDDRLAAVLRLRAGVHVGLAVAQRLRSGSRRFRVLGTPADVAGRLVASATTESLLVSAEVRRLVSPFVHSEPDRAIALHVDSAPVLVYRVLRALDVRSRLEGAAPDGLTPFVGRAGERAALTEHLAQASAGQGRVTILIGEAGAGKSRLLLELREIAAVRDTRVLVGRCDAYGSTTPFLPFIEAMHDVLGLADAQSLPERHEVAVAAVRAVDRSLEKYLPLYLALLAIPSAAYPVPDHQRGEQFQTAAFEAIGALFTLGSSRAPALLLLEDWHWADEASRAALRGLAGIVASVPLLIVVTSRTGNGIDLGTADHQVLLNLSPIDSEASGAIASAVLGASRIAPELLTRLHERTGGNPFFLEELCEALREDGTVVVHAGEASLAEVASAMHVPETVQGVLRTRMDRLEVEARDILRVAAVIGREFARGVLDDVGGAETDIGGALERLKSSGLVQQIALVPEAVYRFKHALTQEVAYDSLLAHQRTTLHAAVGRAIEARYADRIEEHVDRLVHHFGRAELWPDAVRYGLLSADRATGLSQNVDALHMLERVEEWVLRLEADATQRDLLADVMLRQERLNEIMGLRARQLQIVESLIALLAPQGSSARLAQVYLRQGDAYTLLDRYESAERALETALRISRERDDVLGVRNALRSLALLRSHEGRHAEALEKIEQVIALASASGDARAQAMDFATLGNILRNLGQFERALVVLEAALERAELSDHPARYGALLHVVGTVHQNLGNPEKALEIFRRTAHYVPVTTYASFTLPSIAYILLEQGHTAEALDSYREAIALNRKVRYVDGLALACRSMGEVLVGLERHVDAIPYLEEAATLFGQIQDRPNEALMWRRLAGEYEAIGEAGEARAAWERLRDVHHRNMNMSCEAEALEGIARAERKLQVSSEIVVARYEESLALAIRQGDRVRELAVRNALGIVHWQRGSYADAVRCYETALRVCRETGDRVHEGLILNSLGASLNKLSRWDEARTALEDAIRVTTSTGERTLRSHALALLGDVLLACGRTVEACDAFIESLSLRVALADRLGEGWMQQRVAKAHDLMGKPAAAAAAIQSARTIADELQNDLLRAALDQEHPVVDHSARTIPSLTTHH